MRKTNLKNRVPNYEPKEVLYKYIKEEYLREIVEEKVFFINILEAYKSEECKNLQKDEKEGYLKYTIHAVDHIYNGGKNKLFDEVARKGRFINGNGQVGLKNVSFVSEITHNNFYSLCLTTEINDKLKSEFGNCKIIIKNPLIFIEELTKKLKEKGIELHGARSCNYVEKREIVHSSEDLRYFYPHPTFLKLKEYDYQKEYRVLWNRKDNKKLNEPIKIYCPKAWAQCEFIYE